LLDLPSVVFAGESSLHSSLSCGSDHSSTQHAFQVPLDNERFQSLITNSSICDRARLLAASDSTGCSSAGLKAIPHPSLGLAMPVTEFVVDVGIWLGFPYFPLHSCVPVHPQTTVLVTILLVVLMALYVSVGTVL